LFIGADQGFYLGRPKKLPEHTATSA
jgi:hypothetical protein